MTADIWTTGALLWMLLQDRVYSWSPWRQQRRSCFAPPPPAHVLLLRRSQRTHPRKTHRSVTSHGSEQEDEASNNGNSSDNEEPTQDASFVVPQGDEEDCFDLCDIDWDTMMPDDGSARDEMEETANRQQDGVEQDEMMDDEKKAPVDPETARLRLELQWKARENEEDCDIREIDSCGDFCIECTGRGWTHCRFCQGSTKIHMTGGRMMDCPVCNHLGHEACKACRGSGRIAPWTTLTRET